MPPHAPTVDEPIGTDELDGEPAIDPQRDFEERVAGKYAKQDAARLAAEDDEDGHDIDEEGFDTQGDDETDDDADDDADDGDGEHTDEDTADDDLDGDADDSSDDSTDDDDADHPDEDADEAPAESGDADRRTDAKADAKALDFEAEFKAAALRGGIPLTLEDVPAGPARKLVQQKLKAMEAGYTRVRQEATAWRAEQVQARAEARFLEENPDLALAELLQAHPELIERVQGRLDKLDGDDDALEAFKIIVKGKRQDALEAERSVIAAREQHYARVEEIESTGKRVATKRGLPWSIAERAVEAAILRKPPNERFSGLNAQEIDEAITEVAGEYHRHVRKNGRAASRATIVARSAARQATSPTSGARAGVVSPRTGHKRPTREPQNEDERIAMMMRSARRIKPGARDE